MYSLVQFTKSSYSLVVYRSHRRIFSSRARALKPLVSFLRRFGAHPQPVIVFDRCIGRAAALILSLVRPRQVLTPVISKAGVNSLRKYSIPFTATKRVPHLMNLASEGTCRWEMLTSGQTPRRLLKLVQKP